MNWFGISDRTNEPCPDNDLLQDFWAGRLSIPELDAISEHLEQCTTCEEHLSSLVDLDDTIDSCLRRPSPLNTLLEVQEQEHPTFAWKPGEQVGNFLLKRQLGAGGMGVVYEALDRGLGCSVAIKLIHPRYSQNANALARFRREQQVLGKLDHPHIVRARTAGEQDEMHYLVMDFVQGIDLAKLVDAVFPISIADSCAMIYQATLGLEVIHQNWQVHRDIKPSNLMLDRSGNVQILDFGLTRLADRQEEERLTSGTGVLGSVDYMSPEQTSAADKVDIRADIYSLGCSFYELLSGQKLYPTSKYPTVPAKILAHANARIPDIREVRADVPKPLCNLLARMLAKAPSDRIDSPQAIANLLQPFTESSDLVGLVDRVTSQNAEVRVSPTARAQRDLRNELPRWGSSGSRRRLLQAMFGVGGLCAATGAGVAIYNFGLRQRQEKPGPYTYHDADVERLVYLELLSEEPLLLIRSNPDKSRNWADTTKGDLTVDSAGLALLSLGSTDSLNFSLQTRMQRNVWMGSVGLFWGYPVEVYSTADEEFSYQVVFIDSHIAQDGAHIHMLRREIHNTRFYDGVPFTPSKETLSDAKSVQSPGVRECQMELVIKNGRLDEVRWQGQLHEELSDALRSGSGHKFHECRGHFGAFVLDGAVNFRRSQIMFR